MRLRCTNCDSAFDGERNARCPKCLRRTSVVQAMDSTAPPRDGSPAPWPDGDACPLCLTRDISAATFLFELPTASAASAAASTKVTTVRCRCCDGCRERVAGLGRRRSILLPVAMIGMLAWPLLAVSDLPMRKLGLERLEAVMVVTLLCAVLVAVPLVILDRASRSVRKNLEASWLLRRLRARLSPQTTPATSSPARADDWKVLAEAPSTVPVVEATELLRSSI